MATKKLTITLPEDLLDQVAGLAKAAGLPLSTYLTRITEHYLRVEDGLAAMREWQAEHGDFTPDELAAADRVIAEAESGQEVEGDQAA